MQPLHVSVKQNKYIYTRVPGELLNTNASQVLHHGEKVWSRVITWVDQRMIIVLPDAQNKSSQTISG